MRNTLVLVAALVALVTGLFVPARAAQTPSSCDAPYTGCLAVCGNCADALGVPNAHSCGTPFPNISKTACVQACKDKYAACQAQASRPARSYEPGFDRRGTDYFNTTLGGDQTWRDCSALCAADGRCRSWTFVKAGIQHPTNPRCWLKAGVPPATSSSCCTSGVKNAR